MRDKLFCPSKMSQNAGQDCYNLLQLGLCTLIRIHGIMNYE
jgi:hypothetical protein